MEYRELFTIFVLSSIICTGCPNRHKIRCIRMYPILHKKLSTCLDIIYTTLTTASVSGKRLRLCVGNSHTRYEAYPSHVGLHRSANNDKCYLYVHASFPSIHDYWYQGTTSNHTRIYTGILYMFHIATYIPVSKFDLYWCTGTAVGGRWDSNSVLTMTKLSDWISPRKMTINYCYFVNISSLT